MNFGLWCSSKSELSICTTTPAYFRIVNVGWNNSLSFLSHQILLRPLLLFSLISQLMSLVTRCYMVISSTRQRRNNCSKHLEKKCWLRGSRTYLKETLKVKSTLSFFTYEEIEVEICPSCLNLWQSQELIPGLLSVFVVHYPVYKITVTTNGSSFFSWHS